MPEVPQSLPFFFSRDEFLRMVGRLHGHRRVLIDGELNASSIKTARAELFKLELNEIAPILIILESGGGEMVPSHQLQDAIGMLQSPVDVLAIGDCASMAVDIMQMCRTRYMLPSSRLLVHYLRTSRRWIIDDPDLLEGDIRYFHEQGRANRERRFKLYEKRTGHSRAKLEEMFRYGEVHDAYFSAEQAVELKLADEILTDFKLFPQPKKKEE
jgi:ATP-dependent protease ClpP protease subunit